MRINKKLCIIMLLVVSIILSFCINVYAEDEKGTVTLKDLGSGTYKVGDEIKISVSLDVTGFDGVIEFLAKVEYDKNVLEYVEVLPGNGWRVIDANDQIYVERPNMDDSKGVVGTLVFKVKAAANTTTIKVADIDSSGNSGSILWVMENVSDASITIGPLLPADAETQENSNNNQQTPGTTTPDNNNTQTPATDSGTTTPDNNNAQTQQPSDNQQAQNNNQNNNKNTQGNNTNATNKTNNTNTTKKDITTSNTKIPKTGYVNIGIGLVAIGVIAVVILFIRYKKMEKEI